MAAEMGWVKGLTTNPTLLAQAGLPPAEVLLRLAAIPLRPLFYQLTSENEEDMLAEAGKALDIVRDGLVFKIAPTNAGYRFVARQSPHHPCAVTAVYTPAQVLVASEAGARYVIPYVNRATRLLGDGLAMIAGMAAVLKNTRTEIVAASIKSAEEAAGAVQAGAYHLTVPFATLLAMMENQYSSDALQQFREKGVGI
jgi:transaldolase